MTKEERFNQLEKNMKDFEQSKLESIKPGGNPIVIDNFGFEVMFFYGICDKIQKDETYNEEDAKRIKRLEDEMERIKNIPYIYQFLKDGKIAIKKIGFEEK